MTNTMLRRLLARQLQRGLCETTNLRSKSVPEEPVEVSTVILDNDILACSMSY